MNYNFITNKLKKIARSKFANNKPRTARSKLTNSVLASVLFLLFSTSLFSCQSTIKNYFRYEFTNQKITDTTLYFDLTNNYTKTIKNALLYVELDFLSETEVLQIELDCIVDPDDTQPIEINLQNYFPSLLTTEQDEQIEIYINKIYLEKIIYIDDEIFIDKYGTFYF